MSPLRLSNVPEQPPRSIRGARVALRAASARSKIGPSPSALSQEEILQHELSISRHKRTTAGTTGYLPIRCLGPSFDFDQLIERIAVRASECVEPTAINHDTPPMAQFLIVIS